MLIATLNRILISADFSWLTAAAIGKWKRIHVIGDDETD
jgi:hypothetical protein